MSTPPPDIPTNLVGIWHRGYDAGLRKASADPPYPTISSSFVGYMCNIWSDGYVAGLEYREAHGIRLRPRKYPTEDRTFWDHVDVCAPDACWLWKSHVDAGGYGRTVYAGRPTPAHRVAHELVNGDVPADYHVHHTCRTRGCCNPRHLVALTTAEHGEIHRRDRCKSGRHEYTPENTYIRRTGVRECRACRNEYAAEFERQKRWKLGATPRGTRKAECRHGHPYTPENTIIEGDSYRCRICTRARRAARAEKRRAAHKAS